MNSNVIEKRVSNINFQTDEESVRSLKIVETFSNKCFLNNVIKPIFDKSTEVLEVKQGDLKNVHEPKAEKYPKKEKSLNVVAVQKLRPLKCSKSNKTKVAIAIPAPPDAPLKEPVFQKDSKNSGAAGKFGADGKVIPHSILGSVEDFLKEAEKDKEEAKRGEEVDDTNGGWCKDESHKTKSNKLLEESKPLKHWRRTMRRRMCQQNYLSCLLMRPVEHLAMNQGELRRKADEACTIIDLVAPFVEHGKGVRTGSEFWQESMVVSGNEECGALYSRPSHKQKGYTAPMSFVDIPDFIQCCEKGLDKNLFLSSISRPWLKSEYLKRRLDQLGGLFYELNPHIPQTNQLMIYGCNYNTLQRQNLQTEPQRSVGHMSQWDFSGVVHNLGDTKSSSEQRPRFTDSTAFEQPISNVLIKTERTVENFVNSPALVFGDHKVSWQEQPCSTICQKDVEIRVAFEAEMGYRMDSKFQVTNNGSTAVFYGWSKIETCQSFEESRYNKSSKFYFNPTQGVILPGESRFFNCGFKSCDQGIFNEQWQFLTNPVVGGKMIVTFRGVAFMPDYNVANRNQLIGELMRRASFQVAGDLVEEILCSVKETERPLSPPPLKFEDEIFASVNCKKFVYRRQKCQELRDIHKEVVMFLNSQLNKDDGDEGVIRNDKEDVKLYFQSLWNLNSDWDLDVESLKELIMLMPEDEEMKQDLLVHFNSILLSISVHGFTPLSKNICHQAVYSDVCESIERIDRIDRISDGEMDGKTKHKGDEVEVAKDKKKVSLKVKEAADDEMCAGDKMYADLRNKERFYTMAYNIVLDLVSNVEVNLSGFKHPCKETTVLPTTNVER